MENPLKYFAELRDPRVERNREHLLEEVLLIAIAAVLSGAESWNDIADYGEAKLEWLKTFLTLPSGIPSHDTFNRVFAALDPEQFEKGFVAWVSLIAKLTAGEVVAIEGKALRGTREPGGKAIVHMVSAWAEGNGLVLAQRKVDEKSNEITAIPKLLEALELSGTVVTIDAMGCQRSIAEKIVAKQANYILAVKENQASLLDGIKDSFQMLAADAVAEEIDCGLGRVETRPARSSSICRWSKRRPNGRRCRGWCVSKPSATTRRQARPSRLQRRPLPQTSRSRRAKLLHPQPDRPQPAQTRQMLKAGNQGETAQCRMESPLPPQITRNLICVGPGRPGVIKETNKRFIVYC